jgi:saccharopine dehydrogenase (NADP+, L-glutamate forming)
MGSAKPISIYPAFNFVGYPNRDSTPYSKRYNIPECQTLVRGTLRYAVFPEFVKVLLKLGFLEDTPVPELDPSSEPPVSWKSLTAKAVGCTAQDEE